jgi:guanidinoacetate N-methyltransferase
MKPSIDQYGKEILIDHTGFQVMMEWEKPYMEALVDNLSPFGDVLEVGFGLGYSANRIQTFPINSYTVIENDPEVVERALEWAAKQQCDIRVVEGPWQETLKYLGTFDSIFFDDSPHENYPDKDNSRLYDFYYEILDGHVSPNCRFTAYMDHPVHWVSHPFTTWENKIFQTDIAKNCNYIPNKELNYVCVPLITFPYGSLPGAKRISLGSDLSFKLKG